MDERATENMDELRVEQRHLDVAQARLEQLAEEADPAVFAAAAWGAGAAAALRAYAALRRDQAAEPGPLLVGRLVEEDGARVHVGRCLILDEDKKPLVVSWEAPAAEPFYTASRHAPQGVVHRRRFRTVGRTLSGYSDEELQPERCRELGLTIPAIPRPTTAPLSIAKRAGMAAERAREPWPTTTMPAAEVPPLVSAALPGASTDPLDRLEQLDVVGGEVLLADLERGRDGLMHDIVATIQADQYELIKHAAPGVLVVQGGPGTGKTAVGLHRAAYLLYNDERVRRGRVLVLGPNERFMEYVSQVLPTLAGESVVQSTLNAALTTTAEAEVEDAERERLLGDARVALLLQRLVRSKVQLIETDLSVRVLGTTVRLTPSQVLTPLRRALEHPVAHHEAGELLHQLLADAAADGWYAEGGRAVGSADEDPRAAVLKNKTFRTSVREMWPRLQADRLLEQLFGDLPALFRLGQDVFEDRELLTLLDDDIRSRSGRTPAESVVLDELTHLLDGTAERYAHVVVDEAEELTPMEARAVGRRSVRGDLTLLGDLAQASGRSSWKDWESLCEALDVRSEAHIAPLVRGFRVPAEVLDHANRLLPLTEADVPVPVSVRSVSGSLVFQRHEGDGSLLQTASASAVALHGQGSTVAVVLPEAWTTDTPFEVQIEGVDIHTADTVRGLEYDAVVVVEPAAFLEAGPAGARALYVAMTRGTQLLVVLHERELPDVLVPALVLQEEPVHSALTPERAFALLAAGLAEARRERVLDVAHD